MTNTGNTYDLVIITRDEKAEQMDAVKGMITGFDGKVTAEKKWGKKKFAYPIKKEGTGYYQSWTVSLGAPHIASFKRKLDLDENVLRYLLIKQ